MPTGPGPMVRRRQLGAALRQLRVNAGMTIKDAAEELQIHPAKISRLEKAQRNISVPDVLALLNLYEVTDSSIRGKLTQLARENKEPAWWDRFPLGATTERYIGLEGSASRISDYQLLVPGLLQTRRYTAAVLEAFPASTDPGQKESAIELRSMRREKLSTDTSLDVIIDETAVRRIVGGEEVMREQIDELIRAATSTPLSLQLIPFTNGAHPGIMSGFTVLQFDDTGADPLTGTGSSDVVYIEGISDAVYLERQEDVSQYLSAFETLRKQALSKADTVRFLQSAADSL